VAAVIYFEDDHLTILSRGGRALRTIPIAVGMPLTPAWSPAGGEIAFAAESRENGDHIDIYVMRPDGSKLRRLTTAGANTQPNWSPDGARIVFVKGSSEVWLMRADGSRKRRLFVVPYAADNPNVDNPVSAVWSPDGTKIASTSPGARWISIYNIRSRRRARVSLRLPRGVVVSRYDRIDWQPIP
jgi:Tol biopolymer transport system component